jgi:hypothetical protein
MQTQRGVPVSELERGLREEQMMHMDDASRLGVEIQTREAEIAREATKGKLQAEQEHNQRMQILADNHQRAMDAARTAYDASEVDPDRYWQDKGTAGRILAALAVGLGAMGASRGGRNYAMDIIQGEINKDIAAQQANRAGKLRGIGELRTSQDRMREDVNLLRAKALRAVQMKAQEVAATLTDPKAQKAMAERQAQLAGAEADNVRQWAEREADRVVQSDQYRTIPERVVGGSAPRRVLLNRGEVYQADYQAARDNGMSHKDAQQYATKALRQRGVSKSEAADIATVVHSGLPARREAEAASKLNAYTPEEQNRRRQGFIELAPGRGVVVRGSPEAVNKVRNRLTSYATLEKNLQKLRELQLGLGIFGTMPLMERRAQASTLKAATMPMLNSAIRDEAMTESDKPMFESMVANPDALFDIQGGARLETMMEIMARGKADYMRSQSAVPAESRILKAPDGGNIEVIDFTGAPVGSEMGSTFKPVGK